VPISRPCKASLPARLYFEEVLQVLVPLTEWWHSRRIEDQLKVYRSEQDGLKRLDRAISTIIDLAEPPSSITYWRPAKRRLHRPTASAFEGRVRHRDLGRICDHGWREVGPRGGEAVVQINGVGPFDVTYVDPKDDPRNE
jgi:hypothetical protein